MISNTKAKFDDPAVANNSATLSETNPHVVMVKKRSIEGIHRFVDGFLCGEQQSSMVRIVGEFRSLFRSYHQIQQFCGQPLGRLDVYAQRNVVSTHRNRRDRKAGIVSQRAYNAGWPDWRPRTGFRQCASGEAYSRQ